MYKIVWTFSHPRECIYGPPVFPGDIISIMKIFLPDGLGNYTYFFFKIHYKDNSFIVFGLLKSIEAFNINNRKKMYLKILKIL